MGDGLENERWWGEVSESQWGHNTIEAEVKKGGTREKKINVVNPRQ